MGFVQVVNWKNLKTMKKLHSNIFINVTWANVFVSSVTPPEPCL